MISLTQSEKLIAEADQIRRGKATLFSEIPFKLDFDTDQELLHWADYEKKSSHYGVEDIKMVWEPARFDWAIKLACAYHITKNNDYVESFWNIFEQFSSTNPVNQGLNWISGQEIALRVINWTITAHLIHTSGKSTPDRLNALARSIANHANRITKTLIYARAQNNNHLISEAVGLYTAALFLPDHPDSVKWQKMGIRWFNKAITSQISNDGEYNQHSTNYHRMMLMLSLWMFRLMEISGNPMQALQKERLASASAWLLAMVDYHSGKVPNLGHNDGAFILHFTNANFDDYRPVIQASCYAFCEYPAFPEGEWNDLPLWLGLPIQFEKKYQRSFPSNNAVHRIENKDTWTVMRAVHFGSRPAHADQLHVDLWHRGYNIAIDAGTFHYNLNPPWENALSSTRVHNTITVNHTDQMLQVSRFLWLDWAQAQVLEKSADHIIAMHNGYQKLDVTHQRKLQLENEYICTITDDLAQTNTKENSLNIILQWLLPDWQFIRENTNFIFSAPFGEFRLEMTSFPNPTAARIFIVRGGNPIGDSDESEVINYGWYSPAYAIKQPALSIRYQITENLPIRVISRFIFS